MPAARARGTSPTCPTGLPLGSPRRTQQGPSLWPCHRHRADSHAGLALNAPPTPSFAAPGPGPAAVRGQPGRREAGGSHRKPLEATAGRSSKASRAPPSPCPRSPTAGEGARVYERGEGLVVVETGARCGKEMGFPPGVFPGHPALYARGSEGEETTRGGVCLGLGCPPCPRRLTLFDLPTHHRSLATRACGAPSPAPQSPTECSLAAEGTGTRA